MFPFLFAFMGLDWIMNGFSNNENTGVMSGSSSFMDMSVSSQMYGVHKWVEGYKQVAYADSRGVPTVGIGITSFSNGKKPILGIKYDDDFLFKEYKIHVRDKVKLTRNLFQKWGLLIKIDQNLFDVVCDLFFQGYSQYRQDESKKALLKGKANFANWLLTEDGMWKQFWNPSNVGAYKSRWGVLKRAYWRAHWVMGISKSPQECENWLANYRAGKVQKPVFYDNPFPVY